MKITQDVREYAAKKQTDEQAALGVGMKEKAKEFIEKGAEVYAKAWIDEPTEILAIMSHLT